MSRTSRKNNTKTLRASRHKQRAKDMKERKRLSRQRAEVFSVIEQAHRMKRSKKKGTGDLDANMRQLGYVKVGKDRDVYEQPGHTFVTKSDDVLDKFAKV